MRWTVTVLLLATICAGFPGCDGDHKEKKEQQSTRPTAIDLKSPVISEQFTLLSCPAKPKSTRDLEGCAEHRIVKSDKEINEIVGVILARLRNSSKGAARRFVRSERAWLTYRRAVCESRADIYEGGSAAGIVFAECVADRNMAHLNDLKAFERNLGPK
jgi:uncharacterized protein YecT (DUF1311 family)